MKRRLLGSVVAWRDRWGSVHKDGFPELSVDGIVYAAYTHVSCHCILVNLKPLGQTYTAGGDVGDVIGGRLCTIDYAAAYI